MNATRKDLTVMTLGDHLEELRRRLMLGAAAPIPLMVVLFAVSDGLLEIILAPHYEAMVSIGLPPIMQALSPPEMVLVKMKVSAIFALILSAPWIFYHAWMFVAPGLYREERRFVYLLVPGSVVLTAVGLFLLYYVMLPLMLKVLVMFGARFEVDMGPRLDAATTALVETVDGRVPLRTIPPVDPAAGDAWLLVPEMSLFMAVPDADGVVAVQEIRPNRSARIEQPWRLREVVDFTLLLLAAVVIAFQLPLVMMLLGWSGFVNATWLGGQRRYALFGCAVASAILTPQDIVSMLLMLVPLYGLFELGLLLMRFLPASRVARGWGSNDDDPDDIPPSGPTDDPPAGDSSPAAPMPSPPVSDRGDAPEDVPERPGSPPPTDPDTPVAGADEETEEESTWPRPAGDTVARSNGFAVDPAATDAGRERREGKDVS